MEHFPPLRRINVFGPGTGFLACGSTYGRRLPSLSRPVACWRLLTARDREGELFLVRCREKPCRLSSSLTVAGPQRSFTAFPGPLPRHSLEPWRDEAHSSAAEGGICREGPLPGSWFRCQRSSSPSWTRIMLLPPPVVRSQARRTPRTPSRPRESGAIVGRHAWRSHPELAHERERSGGFVNRWERAAIRKGPASQPPPG